MALELCRCGYPYLKIVWIAKPFLPDQGRAVEVQALRDIDSGFSLSAHGFSAAEFGHGTVFQ
jgi:hypothetical protein